MVEEGGMGVRETGVDKQGMSTVGKSELVSFWTSLYGASIILGRIETIIVLVWLLSTLVVGVELLPL